MQVDISDLEAKLIINNFSDPTVEICDGCPLFGSIECEEHCLADSLVKKVDKKSASI